MHAGWDLGGLRITPVLEAELASDGSGLLPELATAAASVRRGWGFDEGGRMLLAFQAFIVETAERTILVDACLGGDRPSPFPDFTPARGGFLDRLAAAGAPPERVDTVVCTHLHFDHTGWLTRREGGSWRPTFARAEHLVVADELEYWSEHDSPLVLLEDSVSVVLAEARHQRVAADHAIAPEVALVPTPGHTPGHASVELRGAHTTALITGDAFHHPVQVEHPEWRDVSDVDHAGAVATRRRLLEHCAEAGTLVIGTHFPAPTAGRVRRDGGGWRIVADRSSSLA